MVVRPPWPDRYGLPYPGGLHFSQEHCQTRPLSRIPCAEWREWAKITLTLASVGGGGGWCNPRRVFLEWPPNRWTDRAENLHSLWGILCAAFREKLTGSGQVTELWHHKRTAFDRLFRDIVCSATELAAIDWNGDIMNNLGQQMTTPDF